MPTKRTVDTEFANMLVITGRLRRRLGYGLRPSDDDSAGKRVPDSDWRETYATYIAAMRVLGNRQHQVRSTTPDKAAPALTDEEFQSEIRSLAQEAVLELDDGELAALLERRRSRQLAQLPAGTGRDRAEPNENTA